MHTRARVFRRHDSRQCDEGVDLKFRLNPPNINFVLAPVPCKSNIAVYGNNIVAMISTKYTTDCTNSPRVRHPLLMAWLSCC